MRIVVRQGGVVWGETIARSEDDARHGVYETSLRSLIATAYPDADVEIAIDRRTDAWLQVRAYASADELDMHDGSWLDGIERHVHAMTDEAYQAACETQVQS